MEIVFRLSNVLETINSLKDVCALSSQIERRNRLGLPPQTPTVVNPSTLVVSDNKVQPAKERNKK